MDAFRGLNLQGDARPHSDDDIAQLTDILTKRMPNAGITHSRVADALASGVFRDVLDPCAAWHPDRLRAALDLKQVMTRFWRPINIDYRLTPEARLLEMQARSTKGRLLNSIAGQSLEWDISADEVISYAHVNRPATDGPPSMTAETVRFKAGTTSERVIMELRKAGLRFAGFEHLTAYIGPYLRKFPWGTKIMITKPGYIYWDQGPNTALVCNWGVPARPRLHVATIEGNWENKTPTWSGAHLLTVRDDS